MLSCNGVRHGCRWSLESYLNCQTNTKHEANSKGLVRQVILHWALLWKESLWKSVYIGSGSDLKQVGLVSTRVCLNFPVEWDIENCSPLHPCLYAVVCSRKWSSGWNPNIGVTHAHMLTWQSKQYYTINIKWFITYSCISRVYNRTQHIKMLISVSTQKVKEFFFLFAVWQVLVTDKQSVT